MNAALIAVGDELLIGQVVNTNAPWAADRLLIAGIDVVWQSVAPDDVDAIVRELTIAYQVADVVIMTGGLGPTHDDVTRHALASFFGAELALDEATLEQIRARFALRDVPMARENRVQAMVPTGFDILPNRIGTAPGLYYERVFDGVRRICAVVPGVPREMKALLLEEVLPRLRAHRGQLEIRQRTLHTSGIGESNLQEKLGDIKAQLEPGLRLAYLPGTSGVRLRLSARGTDPVAIDGMLDRIEAYITSRLGNAVFGKDGARLEAVVGTMLKAQALTIAVAESCTGGHVLDLLTNCSGASAYVLGGVVAYANRIKVAALGVDPETIERHGAVSENVARQMASGVRARFGADVGVSTTGILGPTGGTDAKPVGTIWIGLADETAAVARHIRFGNDRLTNKERTAFAVLNLVRLRLLRGAW